MSCLVGAIPIRLSGLCDRTRALLCFVFPVLSVHGSHRFQHYRKVLVDRSLVVFVFPARVVGRFPLVHKHTDICHIHRRTMVTKVAHLAAATRHWTIARPPAQEMARRSDIDSGRRLDDSRL